MTGQRGRERGRERGPTPRSRAGIAGTVYPRGKKWAYAVTLAPDPLTGERRRDARSGFDTEKAAWDALIEANNQLRSNTYVKNSTTTVGQFLDQWLTTISISVKPTTHSNYRNYADYYVIPIIGDRKLQDLTTDTITSLYTHLLHRGRRRGNSNQLIRQHWKRATGRQETPSARELATIGGVSYSAAVRALQRYRAGRVPTAYSPGLDPRTVHSVHIMLNRAFADAVTQRLLSDNPVTDAARVRQTRKAHTVWNPEQLRRFLTQARPERLYPMWLMFATTGNAPLRSRRGPPPPPRPSLPHHHPLGHPRDRRRTGPPAPTARPADPAAASPSTTAPSPPSPPTSPPSTRNGPPSAPATPSTACCSAGPTDDRSTPTRSANSSTGSSTAPAYRRSPCTTSATPTPPCRCAPASTPRSSAPASATPPSPSPSTPTPPTSPNSTTTLPKRSAICSSPTTPRSLGEPPIDLP